MVEREKKPNVKRNKELDSLRGLAALSVLLYHALATNSSNLTAGISLEPVHTLGAQLLVYTPLHVVWLGAEAVWFFFMLSGFVLTRWASRDTFTLDRYYPSRIVRLYLPVLAAVVLAWVAYTAATMPYPTQSMLLDAALVGGTSTYMGVLWSLQWEVIFSLALPLYLILLRDHRKASFIVAALACFAGFFLDVQAPSFLPMFFFGALLADRWDWIVARFQFLTTGTVKAHLAGFGLTVAAVCAITSFFTLGKAIAEFGLHARTITMPLIIIGICMIMVLGMLWPPLSRLLTLRPLVFLGAMSFSLYLVHRPIVLIYVHLLDAGKLAAVLAVATSLIIGWLFYLIVEKPAHKLARGIASGQRAVVEVVA